MVLEGNAISQLYMYGVRGDDVCLENHTYELIISVHNTLYMYFRKPIFFLLNFLSSGLWNEW